MRFGRNRLLVTVIFFLVSGCSLWFEIPPPFRGMWITHNGDDGLGHQLLGTFSCMLLARLEPRKYRYGERNPWRHGFDHQCANCAELYHALHAGWPTVPKQHTGMDNCWGRTTEFCGLETNVSNTTCNAERRELAAIWRRNFRRWHPSTAGPAVAMHIRKGDRPVPVVAKDYVDLLSRDDLPVGRASSVAVFAEHASEVAEIVKKIPNAAVTPGKGTVHDFIQMVNAGILIPTDSSFSLVAAIIRTGRTYHNGGSVAIGGRYDGHRFNCHIPSSNWWYEDTYANTSCSHTAALPPALPPAPPPPPPPPREGRIYVYKGLQDSRVASRGYFQAESKLLEELRRQGHVTDDPGIKNG
eukprot:COSAG01_NODE_2630_length_7348_cov_32.536626_2_plen_355_part_00